MHGAPEPGFATQPRRLSPTTPELRIAFLGDQSMGPDAHAVLQLVAREKADAVVHLGDFAYDAASPTRWLAQIDSALGPDFPYFAAVGNHDVANWSGPGGFAELLRARLARVPEARCSGELGVNSLCRFRGLSFVLSGVGTYGREHEAYLESALSQVPSAFRLCLWHKNQHDMQVGGKLDEVGWEAYRICARHGALIITAHEHSYARTRTLEAISDRGRGHGATGRPDALTLEPGSTAVIVTGLGGHSARAHTDDHNQDSWWASVYAQDYQLQNGVEVGRAPNIHFGALFIDFNVEGDPFRAFGYFKTTDGAIHDRFVVQTAHYARGK
jgi:3',5'-cyclic AMP phosphodiesterase CpdA